MKTVKLFTLGCKVNQYETQAIRESLLMAGLKEANNGSGADCYVINTCTVTHKADSESLRLIRLAKKESPQAKIVVTGCFTENDRSLIVSKFPGISIVTNSQKHRIPELLSETAYIENSDSDNRGISYFEGHTRAFIKIQDGCNNFCTYCKVPFVRGSSRSRQPREIIQEAERLADNGYKEVVLTGICLGEYGRDLGGDIDLTHIIFALEKISRIRRIRLSSIEVNDISESLIRALSVSSKLCKHLHIPLQSGDDHILSRMKRRYNSSQFLKAIDAIRKSVDAISITTDVLVGFPGENESNFNNTVSALKEIIPLKTHIFPYSQRAGTQASLMRPLVQASIVSDRIGYLKKECLRLCNMYRTKFIGMAMSVIIEDTVEKEKSFWRGYTDNYIRILFDDKGKKLENSEIKVVLSHIISDEYMATLPLTRQCGVIK